MAKYVKYGMAYYSTGFFILMGAFMYLIYSNAWHLNDDDLGRPQNWFPGVAAFAGFLMCFYKYFSIKKSIERYDRTYLGFCSHQPGYLMLF